jgi:protein O-GlcNAc transferase
MLRAHLRNDPSDMNGNTALYDLLHRAASQHQAGQLAAAATLYLEALALHPGNADAHHNLGVLAMQQGRGLAVALPHFRQAWENNPAQPQFGLSYLKALTLAKQFEEARRVHEDGLRRGFAWPPLAAMQTGQGAAVAEPPEGWRALATRRFKAGMLPEALDAWSRALAQRPDDHEARLGQARTLLALHRLREAEAAFRDLISLRPQWPAAHCGHAEALLALERPEEAETAWRHALAIDPLHTDACTGLGRMLLEAGRDADAEALCRDILTRDPKRVDVHYDLGTLLLRSGRLDEAREHYARVVTLQPDHLEARSVLLFLEHYTARQASAALLEQSRAYGERVRALAKKPWVSWTCSAEPKVLRVGLVSGDLREHPVGYFLEGLLAHHDPSRIEWLAYPTHAHDDALSERLRRHLKAWHPLAGLSDADAARRIRDDGVHVLLDLSGHTVHNRLPLFAWRPAPVAASWLGYFATTGVSAIDYVIADRIGVPESLASAFTERLLYLPDTRLCFTAPAQAPEPAPLPASTNGFLTFGCFQAQPKITDAVLQLWSRILAQCPGSRLRIQNAALATEAGRLALRERLVRAGIDPARVDLHGFSSRLRYLEDCGEVDLILDTFPYPGGTTTCEALWMGVPTLTLCGETMIARQGASLLAAAGLEDWITDSEEAYVAAALAHAGNVGELAKLRQSLRERLPATPLFDAARFACNLEQVLRQAWQETGLPRLRGRLPSA